MRAAGGLLMVFGAAVALFSFVLDTSITTYTGLPGPSQIVNLGKLQNQMMVLHSGLAMFIAGAVLFAAPEAQSAKTPADETAEDRDRRYELEDETSNRMAYGLLIAGFGVLALVWGLVELGVL